MLPEIDISSRGMSLYKFRVMTSLEVDVIDKSQDYDLDDTEIQVSL